MGQVCAFVRAEDPDVVFLMETKLNLVASNNLWRQLRFSNAIVVPAVGLAGGLCLMWKLVVGINLVSATTSVIVVEFFE
ncbi:Endonuclease/exonuclease/phosphatase, partial [Parasponia andersonii]